MPMQSNIWFGLVAPANVPTPNNGYYALFISDGSGGTTSGQMYRKDSTGTVTLMQSKAALGITVSDVSGLGTAAVQPASAFDAAGLAAAAQAASQPVDSDLTAIAALSTTTFGRNLLTLADATALTNTVNLATSTAKGLMSATDKLKMDNLGTLGSITAPVIAGGSGAPTALLTVPIPAGLSSGQTFIIRVLGNATGGGFVTFRVHAGTNGNTNDTAVWTSITSQNMSTNQRGGFDGLCTLRNNTVQCECVGFFNTSTLPSVTAAPASVAINPANPWYITLSAQNSILGGGYVAQQAVILAT